eukprot:TRINITY_DN4902_c0_g1_i1.p1 TRINITY_DN4902_c0_g1~~TRINITY_DN4902_c0_g1_i1.p1  ORF type:complete len:291 (-),score=20.96 TRINITY_DN4902_c0_g1_i1:60-932(-)
MPAPRMFVREWKAPASGRTLVLLHGFPSMGYSYRGMIEAFATGLGAPFARILIPDWPGWGHSENPSPSESYRYAASDLLRSLEQMFDVLLPGDRAVTLVVQGWASPIAMAFAGRHPGQVASLIAINPPLGPDGKLAALPKYLNPFLNVFMAPILAQDPTRWADLLFRESGKYFPQEAAVAVYRAPFLTDGLAGVTAVETIKGLTNSDFRSMWDEWVSRADKVRKGEVSEIPSLVLLSTEDRFATAAYAAREAAARAIGFRSCRKLMDVGHFAQEDWPEGVAAAIAAFGSD